MTTATKQPTSISAMLDAALTDAAVYRTKQCAPPWSAPWGTDEAPSAAAESPLLTVAQAAEIVPLSTKQLYRVAASADSPFRKVEGRLMAYETDLHAWIKKHPTGGPAESPAAAGDSLADRVRRRREGGAA